jgi:hypothetical protein
MSPWRPCCACCSEPGETVITNSSLSLRSTAIIACLGFLLPGLSAQMRTSALTRNKIVVTADAGALRTASLDRFTVIGTTCRGPVLQAYYTRSLLTDILVTVGVAPTAGAAQLRVPVVAPPSDTFRVQFLTTSGGGWITSNAWSIQLP